VKSVTRGAEAAGVAAAVVTEALVLADCAWVVVGAPAASKRPAATAGSRSGFISN